MSTMGMPPPDDASQSPIVARPASAPPAAAPPAAVASPALAAPARPIAPDERIVVIDVLRGFALLGIVSVNMIVYSTPMAADIGGTPLFTEWYDRAARHAIDFFATSKFYSLFSFLFGFGMSVQFARAQARGAGFSGLTVRRLIVLLGIGAAHVLLLWFGDILTCYAVLGFVLLAFLRCRRRTLLIWAVVFAALPPLFMSGCAGMISLVRSSPTAAAKFDQRMTGTQRQMQTDMQREIEIYRRGTFREICVQRAQTYLLTMLMEGIVMAPNILAMFLLGFCAGRDGALDWVAANRQRFKRALFLSLAIGLIGNLVWVRALHAGSWTLPTWTLAGGFGAIAIAAPALALVYAGTIVLAWDAPMWRRRLQPLAAVGRMALTNYLLQSLICTTIFYSYGLGLFAKVGHLLGLALSIAIWLLQIPLSNWWLAHFQFGPVEWLWRSLTYGQAQPMRTRIAPTLPH